MRGEGYDVIKWVQSKYVCMWESNFASKQPLSTSHYQAHRAGSVVTMRIIYKVGEEQTAPLYGLKTPESMPLSRQR